MLELDADALALGRLDVFGLLHDHVGVHHDQAAVGVVDEPLVARLLHQAGNRLRAQADVQHGFHHAGHRGAGAAAAAHQQRLLGVAELHAHRLFGLPQGGGHFVAERLRELPSLGEKDGAEFGADGETGGHGQPQLGHLGQVGAPCRRGRSSSSRRLRSPAGRKSKRTSWSCLTSFVRCHKKVAICSSFPRFWQMSRKQRPGLRGRNAKKRKGQVYQPSGRASRIGARTC